MENTDTELAYLAGLFDGEGYVCICRTMKCRADRHTPKIALKIGLSMIDEPVVQRFASRFGARVRKRASATLDPGFTKGTRRDLFCLVLTGQKAGRALSSLRPYLQVKAPQADLALRFLESFPKPPYTHGRGQFLAPSIWAFRLKTHHDMHALNHKGSTRPDADRAPTFIQLTSSYPPSSVAST